jgi:hypothetical protein
MFVEKTLNMRNSECYIFQFEIFGDKVSCDRHECSDIWSSPGIMSERNEFSLAQVTLDFLFELKMHPCNLSCNAFLVHLIHQWDHQFVNKPDKVSEGFTLNHCKWQITLG